MLKGFRTGPSPLQPQSVSHTLAHTVTLLYLSVSKPLVWGGALTHVYEVPMCTYVITFGYFSVVNLSHVNLIIRPAKRI